MSFRLSRSAGSKNKRISDGILPQINGFFKGSSTNVSEIQAPSDHSDQDDSATQLGLALPATPASMISHSSNGAAVVSKPEISYLKETTSVVSVQCKKELGSEADDALMGTPTIDSLLDFIASERLKSMPHRGSRWDKVLKWAESFARNVYLYSQAIEAFVIHSREAARLIWGSCRLLLQMGPKNIEILEKAFGVLHQMGDIISFFLQSKPLFTASEEICRILARAYSDIVQLASDVTILYKKKNTSEHFFRLFGLKFSLSKDPQGASKFLLLGGFDSRFGPVIDSFYHHKGRFMEEVWAASLRESALLQGSSVSIRTLRQWLAPHDRTLEILISGRIGINTARQAHTCEWFGTHLEKFQKGDDHALVVTGQPGSGKSVLVDYIMDRLRRNSGRKIVHDVISFTIDANLKTHSSTLSVIKSLLLQLLERNVGDASLYKALSAVYESTERQSTFQGLENRLWKTLESALKKRTNRLLIVVDGLDQLEGGDTASVDLCSHLVKLATNIKPVKCILLSRPLSKSYPPGVRQIVIDSTYNAEDVACFVKNAVSSFAEFVNLRESDKQAIIQKVSKMSNGTFIWADLTLQLLKREKTLAAILQSLETTPKALPDLLQKLCSSLDLEQADTRLIISALLVAERPLTLLELKNFLELDVRNCSHSPRLSSVEEDIYKACGSLVVVRDGIVRFSHLSIKQHLLTLASSGKLPLTVKGAHNELTTRSLAYIKISLKESKTEPTFEYSWDSDKSLLKRLLPDLLQKHHLLEYSMRYWLLHFRRSSMYETKSKYTFTSEFKGCFSDSTLWAMAEGSWWETQTSANDAADLHSLALDLRKSIVGAQSKSVIQCHINLGRTKQNISGYSEASKCYFDAWKVSQSVIGQNSAMTVACAKAYTKIATNKVMTTKTEITTRTEEIYRYMWSSYKHAHGEAHEETVKYAVCLASFYTQLKKTEQAAIVYREVYTSCTQKYGLLHKLTISTSQKLTTVLQQLSRHEECLHICQSTLEVSKKTLEVWEHVRIAATIRMVEAFESQKQLQEAEQLLTNIRKSLIEVCHSRHEDHIYEAKVEVTIHYVQFLKRHSQEKTAKKILIELWNESEHLLDDQSRCSESLIVRIKAIGEEMKRLEITTVAESVFSRIWGFFKKTNRQTSKEAISIAVSLSEIYKIHEESYKEETILKEIYEVSTSTSTATTIETTTITTCTKLGAFYERESRWSEAVDVCSKVLLKLWPSIDIPDSEDYYLPHYNYEDVIQITHRLGRCHHRAGSVEKAESIYLRLFRACRSSLQLHDEKILTTAKFLVSFYESIGKVDQSRTVYTELLEEYRGFFGSSHPLTIRITYLLAHHCDHHQPRDAERFYLDIFAAFNQHSEECDTGSIEAALALCKIYEKDKKFKEARKIYRRLWLTVHRHGTETGLDSEAMSDIYHRYLHILEKDDDFSVICELTIQYKDTCVKYYGVKHQMTIKATIQLAKILERKESRREEAVKIYEELCHTISETHEHSHMIESTMIEIRLRLAHIYSAHALTTKKAETIYYESWDQFRCKYGYAHEQTLTRLHELVVFFKKQNTKECKHTAAETLQKTIIEVITREKDSHKLFHSAEAIASMYLALDLKEIAFELLGEIRRQLISTEIRSSKKFGFALRQGHTVDRRSFVFVRAFEEGLKGVLRPSRYSEIVGELMTETTLYESWMRSLKYGGSIESILGVGAQLRFFLEGKDRDEERDKITDEMWELFHAELGGSSKKSGTLWDLFTVCLKKMGNEEHELTIIDAGAAAVLSHSENGDFKGAYELASWLYKHMQAHGGLTIQRNLAVGLKLSLCMAERTSHSKRCKDQNLSSKMMSLSREILKDVLKASEQEHMSFHKMSIKDLNLIVGLLGEQQNFKDLERILRDLWNERQTHNWSSHTIIWIGRRLCEVQFAHGHKDEAIALCEDICYNLKRVLRTLHKDTISSLNLLSSFYTATGKYEKSIAVHEQILQQTLAEENDYELADDASTIILHQLHLLKRAYQRNGKWDRDESHYQDLWDEFSSLFGSHHPMWSKIDPVKKWSTKRVLAANESLGMWQPPATWDFPSESQQKQLKRYSSAANFSSRLEYAQADEGVALPNEVHHHWHNGIGGRQAADLNAEIVY